MENQELILLELEEFDRNTQTDVQITQNLDGFIEHVSKTGTYIFPWNKIKKLYLTKMRQTIESFNHVLINNINKKDEQQTTTNDNDSNKQSKPTSLDTLAQNELKERLFERMKSFNSAPFTIQRISELLLKPKFNYNRIDKYLRGLEKCVMVVSTVDPNGNKIFTDNSQQMTNGLPSSSSSSSLSSPILSPLQSTNLPLLLLPPPPLLSLSTTTTTTTTCSLSTTTTFVQQEDQQQPQASQSQIAVSSTEIIQQTTITTAVNNDNLNEINKTESVETQANAIHDEKDSTQINKHDEKVNKEQNIKDPNSQSLEASIKTDEVQSNETNEMCVS